MDYVILPNFSQPCFYRLVDTIFEMETSSEDVCAFRADRLLGKSFFTVDGNRYRIVHFVP